VCDDDVSLLLSGGAGDVTDLAGAALLDKVSFACPALAVGDCRVYSLLSVGERLGTACLDCPLGSVFAPQSTAHRRDQ